MKLLKMYYVKAYFSELYLKLDSKDGISREQYLFADRKAAESLVDELLKRYMTSQFREGELWNCYPVYNSIDVMEVSVYVSQDCIDELVHSCDFEEGIAELDAYDDDLPPVDSDEEDNALIDMYAARSKVNVIDEAVDEDTSEHDDVDSSSVFPSLGCFLKNDRKLKPYCIKLRLKESTKVMFDELRKSLNMSQSDCFEMLVDMAKKRMEKQ